MQHPLEALNHLKDLCRAVRDGGQGNDFAVQSLHRHCDVTILTSRNIFSNDEPIGLRKRTFMSKATLKI
jgi:hypothetical protein